MSMSGKRATVAPQPSLASVPDDELDAYIADQIVQRSRAKEASSNKGGTHSNAYDDAETAGLSRSRVLNTNKKFLASVITNVEGHNQALLRQQAREAERAARRDANSRSRSPAPTGDGPSSKLRGWSDEDNDALSSSHTLEDGASRRRSESPGLSGKMDRYFDESASKSEEAESKRHSDEHSKDKLRDDRRNKGHYSKHGSQRHLSGKTERKNHADESRHRPSSHKESREHRHADDHGHKREERDVERRKRRKEGDREKGNSSRRRSVDCSIERKSSRCRSDERRKELKEESSTRSKAEDRQPKTKVRERDLGKDSLAI
ncbi:hypothetical protein NDA13_001377 [Ustilago tritici]|nr:hypothetical protein NDA13_001377 [Ustilago tritici]